MCVLDAIRDAPKSDMITEEELQYYVDYFTQGGIHGLCKWYRTTGTMKRSTSNSFLPNILEPLTRLCSYSLPNSTIEAPALLFELCMPRFYPQISSGMCHSISLHRS
ncbi:hypothetical protein L211DRAFT_835493 [Terfezia boudieri ATCC MYA-4762]|uniref:Uncharacterized protein n=1 Tax=Terfezia boudieri ATCC MYA-4762 TaxID=1051890 RepID=A0A3N4LTI6_9PEZI|nr:hypothetical protein L211DRAFT_835493 [Terfezia boudieri ATCC MYA-4762]